MSRAFVNEDAGGEVIRYVLPPRDDPDFPAAAARALIQGANVGDSTGAEEATGYVFGDERLRPFVEQILERARAEDDDRTEQLAERFLSRIAASRGPR